MASMMYDEMLKYFVSRGRRWSWGRCDCAGLLVHLLEAGGHGTFDRRDYIDPTLTYQESIDWLASLPDPMSPWLDILRDAGLAPVEAADAWDVAVTSTEKPIPLFGGREFYPTDIAPGLVFKPANMHAVILHRRGYAQVPVYEDRIRRIFKYRLFDE